MTVVTVILGVISFILVVAFIIMLAWVTIKITIDTIKDLKESPPLREITPHVVDENDFYIGQRVSLKDSELLGVADRDFGTIMAYADGWYFVNTDKTNGFNHPNYSGNGVYLCSYSIKAIEGENNEK